MSKYFSYKRGTPKWKRIRDFRPWVDRVVCLPDGNSYPILHDLDGVMGIKAKAALKHTNGLEWLAPWADPVWGDPGGEPRQLRLDYAYKSKQFEISEFFDYQARAPMWTQILKRFPFFNFCEVRENCDIYLTVNDNHGKPRLTDKKIGHLEEYHGTGFTWEAPWASTKLLLQNYIDKKREIATLISSVVKDVESYPYLIDFAEALGGKYDSALKEVLTQ